MKQMTNKLILPLAVFMAVGTAKGAEPNPYLKQDNSLISISGTVVAPKLDEFVLDYGSGMITVEMDDWDAYGEASNLMDGDRVTVYGRVDDDLFEIASIEAGSVYVENLNTFFYASAADEEAKPEVSRYWTASSGPLIVSETSLRGTVTAVDEKQKRFNIKIGETEVTVDADGIGYNPLDDFGYQQIDEGDFVSVTGEIDHEFMEGRVFQASRVTTLVDGRSGKQPAQENS